MIHEEIRPWVRVANAAFQEAAQKDASSFLRRHDLSPTVKKELTRMFKLMFMLGVVSCRSCESERTGKLKQHSESETLQ